MRLFVIPFYLRSVLTLGIDPSNGHCTSTDIMYLTEKWFTNTKWYKLIPVQTYTTLDQGQKQQQNLPCHHRNTAGGVHGRIGSALSPVKQLLLHIQCVIPRHSNWNSDKNIAGPVLPKLTPGILKMEIHVGTPSTVLPGWLPRSWQTDRWVCMVSPVKKRS